MKREIKFRGKDVETDKWVDGDLIQRMGYMPSIMFPYNSNGKVRYGECAVKRETVGQFTGLTDKNGNEIYEGDLLRFPAKDQYEQNNFVAYEIFWHDNDCADRHIGWQMNRQHFQGSLCGNDMGLITFLPHWSEKMEVIGNIHDDRELIKD